MALALPAQWRADAHKRRATHVRRPSRARLSAVASTSFSSPGPGQASFAGKPGVVSFVQSAASPQTVKQRLVQFLGSAKLDRQKLAALGGAALLSYGFVSNVNAVTLLILSWLSFARTTGLSPLAPGQWKAYLLAYTALYAVVGNGLRPLRFSLSVAITPAFDRFVALLQRRLKLSKTAAFATCVFLVNVCGTCTYLVVGLRLATLAAGVPFLP